MIVMVLQNTPPSLRGKVSTYLIETANGVYIGDLSARVRDKLWATCEKSCREGMVFQAWSTNNEQGFQMRMLGGERCVVDFEGLLFVREPARELSPVEKRRTR